ncbi:MAG: UPF0280 family protein [Bacteroidaceae bacterium]|nr:UPF0280 family protein [Bacteroidaceae bacterium]
MEYKERTYRDRFSSDGRRSFSVKYKETDLWIGVDKDSYSPFMQDEALSIIIKLRNLMDSYLLLDPEYKTSLVPYFPQTPAPQIFHDMSAVCKRSEIGPMSAVAGAVAKYTALELKQKFPYREIMVENGGDIYIDIKEDIDIAVFAGQSPLSNRVGLHIPASVSPVGVCTSSGTVGPSLSFGKADAVMIVCKDVLLADSYATAMANRVKTTADIESVIDYISVRSDILGALIVKDDKMAVTGCFELRIFQ